MSRISSIQYFSGETKKQKLFFEKNENDTYRKSVYSFKWLFKVHFLNQNSKMYCVTGIALRGDRVMRNCKEINR